MTSQTLRINMAGLLAADVCCTCSIFPIHITYIYTEQHRATDIELYIGEY